MKHIYPQKACELVREASLLSADELLSLQTERLKELVSYAREHSPYLAQKYANLEQDFALCDIPVSTRAEIVEHFAQWVCDPQITLESIESYLGDRNNILEKYLGKYSIAMTSGTTAAPLRIVRDARHNAIHGALMSERYFHGSLLKDVEGADDPNIKSCAIIPNTGFHSSYLSFLRFCKSYEARGIGDRALLVPIDMPTAGMVKALNDFQPEMIGCYPSVMLILAYEQKAGRLNIHPRYIGCSAEKLTEKNRQLISEAFGCPVNDNYCSTEGGEVAMLCSCGNLHVNSDWIIMEQVDEQCRPVPHGEKSHGVLLTNLANLTQPVIRYLMTDNITLFDQPCGCGLPLPYLSIDGRLEDMLEFEQGGKATCIAGKALSMPVTDLPGCKAAQIIQRSEKSLEVRLAVMDNFDKNALKLEVEQTITRILKAFDAPQVSVEINEAPFVLTKGGKMRVVYRDFA